MAGGFHAVVSVLCGIFLSSVAQNNKELFPCQEKKEHLEKIIFPLASRPRPRIIRAMITRYAAPDLKWSPAEIDFLLLHGKARRAECGHVTHPWLDLCLKCSNARRERIYSAPA